MSPQDAFHATCHDYPGGCESLAPRMGMTPGVLRNKANLHSTTNIPSLWDADRAMAVTGDYRVLHALAGNHAHVCIQIDDNTAPSDVAVLEMVTHVWRAHGGVGSAVDAALEDGRIEAHEVEQIRDAIYRTIQSMQQMLGRIEQLCDSRGS